jgi:hypothetical protein
MFHRNVFARSRRVVAPITERCHLHSSPATRRVGRSAIPAAVVVRLPHRNRPSVRRSPVSIVFAALRATAFRLVLSGVQPAVRNRP